MKDGFPGVGNLWDDSSAANEKMRLSLLESRDIRWSLTMVSYSTGRGGRGSIRSNLFPSGPQQKPGFSPVKRITPHLLHAWTIPRWLTAPHLKSGEDIPWIFPIASAQLIQKFMLISTQHFQ